MVIAETLSPVCGRPPEADPLSVVIAKIYCTIKVL